jgi:D-alanyl-D-alanine carboxypeptidase
MVITRHPPSTSHDPTAAGGGRLRRRTVAGLAVAVAAFALTAIGVLPYLLTLPAVGLLLAAAAPSDHVASSHPLRWGRRNAAVVTFLALALATVVLKPQLLPLLVDWFGVDLQGLIVAALALSVPALPLALAESATPIDELPAGRPVATRRNAVLAATVAVTVAIWYGGPGASFMPLALLVLGVPVVVAVTRFRASRHGRVDRPLWHRPGPTIRPASYLQGMNLLVLASLLGASMTAHAYDLLRADFGPGGYRVFQIAFGVGLLATLWLAAFPLRQIRLGTNLCVAAGSVFLATQLVMIHRAPSDAVTVASPLADQWYVGQGGHAELVNYHHVSSSQRDAIDILQVVDGRTHQPGNTDLDSYHIYGKPVLAPADGTITFVVDGHPDQPIGSVDNRHQAGNNLVIDIGGNRYIEIGHLRPGSINVAVGDRVTAGQPIAQVGNSGNTSEPHIHIQAQNQPTGIDDINDINVGEFLRTHHTYPLVFRNVALTRDGQTTTPTTADPRRGDLLRPLDSTDTTDSAATPPPVETSAVDDQADRARRLQETVDATVAAHPELPGILVRVETTDPNGENLTAFAGLSDPAAGTPLRADTTLRIASNTKTYTAAAVLRLVEQGRLELDDPVEPLLGSDLVTTLQAGGFEPARITVRNLLQHTSGLYDHSADPAYAEAVLADPTHQWTRLEQVEFAMEHSEPLGAPGTLFTYSDTGYVLLGAIMERVNGTSLAEAYRQLLRFDTIGLNATWLESQEPVPAGAGERAHQFLGEVDSFDFDPSFDLYGGGGLVADIEDLAHFYQALMTGQVFDDPATLRTMLQVPATNDSGYAMGIEKIEMAGEDCWSHSGFWGTTVISCPGPGVTVATSAGQSEVFNNVDMEPIFKAAFEAAGIEAGG